MAVDVGIIMGSQSDWPTMREAAAILKELGTPCVIHQPSYNMLNRWVETDGLKETLAELGIGSIAFTPLAQGMLTRKYLGGIPEGSRAVQGKSLDPAKITPEAVENIRALDAIAQSLRVPATEATVKIGLMMDPYAHPQHMKVVNHLAYVGM